LIDKEGNEMNFDEIFDGIAVCSRFEYFIIEKLMIDVYVFSMMFMFLVWMFMFVVLMIMFVVQ
jgi:hypothetical protein